MNLSNWKMITGIGNSGESRIFAYTYIETDKEIVQIGASSDFLMSKH